jgi:hypothetical protein
MTFEFFQFVYQSVRDFCQREFHYNGAIINNTYTEYMDKGSAENMPDCSACGPLAERPFEREPFWSIGGLKAKPRITWAKQTVVVTITVIAVLREAPGNGPTNNRNVIFNEFWYAFYSENCLMESKQ